jgi:hypothetical protein
MSQEEQPLDKKSPHAVLGKIAASKPLESVDDCLSNKRFSPGSLVALAPSRWISKGP